MLIGTHDFSGFSSSGRTVEDTVRTISEFHCERKDENTIIISVTANGFLYNMVRILVGTAIGVSDGKISSNDIKMMLESGDRSLGGITAPANGLFLDKVFY